MIQAALAALALAAYVWDAKKQSDAGAAQAKLDEQNAALARSQAADALRRGAIEQGRIRAAGYRTGAAAQVALGANGVSSTEGSAKDVLATTYYNTELDVQNARAAAARQAWGYGVEEQSLLEQAKITRKQTAMGSIGTLLGGVGTAASIAGR